MKESAKIGILTNVENGGLCKQFLAVLDGDDVGREVENVVLIRLWRTGNKVVIGRLRYDEQIIGLGIVQDAVNVKSASPCTNKSSSQQACVC